MKRSPDVQRICDAASVVADEASAAFQKGDREKGVALSRKAAAAYEAALKLAPDDPGIQLCLGAQHFNAGDAAKALEMYERALPALRKGDDRDLLIQALTNDAGALFTVGRPADAVAPCDEILRLDPTNEAAKQIRQACAAAGKK